MHTHDSPHRFEGRRVRLYDVAARRLLRRGYRRLAADVAATAPEGADVLDVGTGPGVLLVELARRRADLRLTGIDLSADMVRAAQRNLRPYGDRATALVGDVSGLPFPDDSFDLVVSSYSLHHWEHPEAAVPELARVLRPGGRLCVYDLPFAPFDTLEGVASASALFTGQPQRSRLSTGVPLIGRCVRFELATAG